MSSKQKTLFQSWGNCGNKQSSQKHTSDTKTSLQPSVVDDLVIDLCDEELNDDDVLLAQALDESIKPTNINSSTYGEHGENASNSGKCPQNSIPFTKVTTSIKSSSSSSLFNSYQKTTVVQGNNESHEEGNLSIGADKIDLHVPSTSSVSLSHVPDLPGFDKHAGQLWIYPTNYPVRDYQLNIVQQCLYNNTLVTLPTGLGKTFIAAVVMYNYYRWYPQCKVVFMAPTKPLVAQQIHACYNIMGIPQQDTAEMTGNMNPTERQRTWKEKRVFFLTPQVITNDLSRGTCPADTVKCLVIDEAHKALGNHAYCQVVRELVKYTQQFRIVALSATPGSDIKAVQQVITNLLISHIELRTEECIDIKPYTHERKVEKIVVALGEELLMIQKKYVQVMSTVVQRLIHHQVLYSQREVTSLSKFLILKAREAFRQNPPPSMPSHQYGVVEGDFALALSLYHGYELLQLHGLRSLYNFLEGVINRDKGYGRTKTELMKNGNFLEIMGLLKTKYTTDDSSWSCSQKQASCVSGHPKMKKLEQVTLEHFKTSHQATRVMIFSQYRDSVQEITDMLNLHRPMVIAMSFIGQSSTGKATKGFTQKEQLKVMKEFREGGYNTLVSTCVGEEGLDIGDVDLIICFDAHKSPIRLVQRMGRTGRKRQGRIVMLVTAGKEEQIYNQSQYSKRSIHKAILNGARALHLYPNNPRMVPDGFSPSCHKMFITVKDVASLNRGTKDPGGAKQKKILTSKTGTWRKLMPKSEEATITQEEYNELKPFLVSNVKRPPPQPSLLCLGCQESEVEENTLSLTEWMLWQNRLQDTQLVDHSQRSQHLVELVEFLQLQETLSETEDHYGVEMEMYLKLDDVLQPGEKDNSEHDGGIPRSSITSERGKLPSRGKQAGMTAMVPVQRRKTVRRSDMLPVIEDWQGEEEDSEGELPEFHTSSISPHHAEANSDKNKTHKHNMKEDVNILHTKREVSLIKPITIDDSDFEEDAPFALIDMKHEEDSLDSDEWKRDLSLGQEKEKLCMAHAECSDDIDHQVISSMLHTCTDVISQGSLPSCPVQLGTLMIRPAPPLQEVDMVFSELRNKAELPPLDLKPIVCEWYEENHGPAGLIFVSNWEKQHQISVGTNLEKDRVCDSTALCSNLSAATGDRANVLLSTDQKGLHTVQTQMVTAGVSDQSSSDSDVNTFTWMKPVPTRPERGTATHNLSVLELNDLKNIPTSTENCPSQRPEKEGLETCDKAGVDIIDLGVSMNRSANFKKSMMTKDDHRIVVSDKPKKLEQETDNIHSLHTDGFANELGSQHSYFEDDIKNDKCPDLGTLQTLHGARSTQPGALSFTQALLCVQSSEEHPHDDGQLVLEDLKQEEHQLDQDHLVVQDYRQENTQDKEQLELEDFSKDHLKGHQQPMAEDFSKDHLKGHQQPMAEDFSQDHLQGHQQPMAEDFSQDHLQGHQQPMAEDFSKDHLQGHQQPMAEDFRQDHLLEPVQHLVKDCKQDTNDIGHFMPSFNLFDNDSDFDDGCQDVQEVDSCSSSSYTVKHSFSKTKVTPEKSTSIKSAPEVMSCDQQQHSEFTDMTAVSLPHSNNNEGDFALPRFDLEFDFDDDVIPPSPMAAQTFSQISLSRSQVSISSRKKLNFKKTNDLVSEERDAKVTAMQCEIAGRTSNEVQHMSWDNLLDDDMGTVNFPGSPRSTALSVGEIMNKTSASKAVSVSPSGVNADQGDILNSMPRTPFFNSPLSSHVRSSTPKVGMSKMASCVSHLAQIATPVMNTVSTRIGDVSTGILASPCPMLTQTNQLSNSPSSSMHSSPHEGCGTELSKSEEESFHVIRKRKVAAILDDTETSFSLQHRQESGDVPSFKTPSRPAARKKQKMKLNFSSDDETESGPSFTKSRSETSQAHRSSSHTNDDDDDDDDFQLGKPAGKSRMANASKIKKKKIRETIKRRGGYGFLDNEAMLSGSEASSDEEWDSNDECLEASFVNDDTLMSQDHVDIHAVYLKSVRSPIQRDRFRLQAHHYEKDVFSQVPEHEDNEYEEDSFCVGDDFQESEYIDEEEHDLLDDFDEFSHYSKRKGAEHSKSNKSKHIVGRSRKRIRQISGSSSDEETRVTTSVLENTQADNLDPHFICSQKNEPVRKKIAAILSSSEEERSPTPVSKSSHHAPPTASFEQADMNTSSSQRSVALLDADKMRQERLAKQKQKQQEFRTMMSKKNGAASICGSYNDSLEPRTACASISGSTVYMSRKSLDSSQTEDRSRFDCEDYDFASDKLSSVIPKPLPTEWGLKDKLVILVDSREISGAQDIVSNLRLQHGVSVVARQLGACDYIISNRTAVDRRQLSDFSNGAQRVKLIDRVQQMRELYDRCCLIVEKDRVKPGEEKSAKLSHRTKYYDWIQSVLVQTNVRLFFTENQGETAALMAQLAQLEKKKEMNVSVPVDVGLIEEQVLKFYTSIPKVSYANALNLCYNYRSISDFLSSCTPHTVSVRGRMSEVRAAEVCRYVGHCFDLQMLPTNR
ncbi:Fanconi anemia group M protein-like [Haliotis asinina]|uniref:Fanconi anemia group M protein-like n=1 Tax=Haliotis asinina TaxID=109174 RepID=UPI0035321412